MPAKQAKQVKHIKQKSDFETKPNFSWYKCRQTFGFWIIPHSDKPDNSIVASSAHLGVTTRGVEGSGSFNWSVLGIMLLGIGSGLSVVVLGHISDGTVFHELAGFLLVLLAKTWHLITKHLRDHTSGIWGSRGFGWGLRVVEVSSGALKIVVLLEILRQLLKVQTRVHVVTIQILKHHWLLLLISKILHHWHLAQINKVHLLHLYL